MEHKNIQYISDSYLCSNCGACSAICAKDAVSFRWTSMGRMYAQVDAEKCVNCGRCVKVCPSVVDPTPADCSDRFVGDIKNLYVGRATDESIFKNAQSGGVCTALLTYLFDAKKIECAIVCQMDAGSPTPEVKARVITDKDELLKTQKSCYTPVEMLSVLKQTHDFSSIAFVGLPCHIEGLTNLQKENKKLSNIKYKIGLICDRTMCRTVMDVFSTYLQPSVIKIDWRRKYDRQEGFHYENAPVVVFSDKDAVNVPNKHRFVMKEYFTSPRCRVCYDKLNVMSDIVLGDPWRMQNVNMTEGESVVLSRTIVGQELVECAMGNGYISLDKRDLQEVIVGQQIEERRQNVARYAFLLKKDIPNEVSSHLLANTSSTFLKSNEISSFLKREQKDKNEVVTDALEQIKKSMEGPSFLQKVKMSLKYRLKILFKFSI